MAQVFKHHQLCKQDGPLGPYIDPYAAEMRGEHYSQQTSEKQIRVVADFGRWLSNRDIQAKEITAELVQPYLRARARRQPPTGNEVPALRRLLRLLVRKQVIPAPVPPSATAADRLQSEFRLLSRICGEILVPGVFPSCDREQFP